MKTKTIDLLNIGLMVGSCALAFVVPFELFLFSYAVLGPLHYLTEITWLHKRDYFTNGKSDYLWLAVICAFVFLLNFVPDWGADAATFMLYLAFVSALGFVLFRQTLRKVLFVIIAAGAGALAVTTSSFHFAFAIFLPTLVHVFIFTGLFILLGALKNRSVAGLASLGVFALCGASFFVLFPRFSFYQASEYAQQALASSGFATINGAFLQVFKLGEATREAVFTSDIGFGVMRFVAFAYTYHYLNWFSKTSVIQWHRVPAKWLASVVVFWLGAIALYAYDYRAGFIALYFLSTLHVILEFPLNYRTLLGIGQEFAAAAGFRKAPAAANAAGTP